MKGRYQAELAFLREIGAAFGRANPADASRVELGSGDPDVERLLQGFAFMVAGLRERLDDGVGELVQDLSEILVPAMVRPVPAATVVEFTPPPGALRDRLKVPAGTELDSVPVDGSRVRFRTSGDLEVLPITVGSARLVAATRGRPELRFGLRVNRGAPVEALLRGPIRLHLHGEYPTCAAVLQWLARHVEGVEVAQPEGGTRSLPTASVRACGLDPALALLPADPRSPPGFQLLQDYFTLPQRFLFFEVAGLEPARDLLGAPGGFELVIRFKDPPELPGRLAADAIRANCVSAVNLFAAPAHPIRLEAFASEVLLRPSGVPAHHAEVHSVVRATSREAGVGATVVELPAFQHFEHLRPGSSGRFFRLRRAASPIDGGLDTYAAVGSAAGGGAPREETLSFDLLCTSRFLPEQLRAGEVATRTRTSPQGVTFSNLLAPTRPARPALGAEMQWKLVSHLALQRGSIADPSALRRLVALYNVHGLSDQQQGRANQLRVDGIRRATASAARRLLDGAPVGGVRLEVELSEANFSGPGDAFLFGAALEDLLHGVAPLDGFAEAALRLEPSGRVMGWPPRAGRRPLL